MFRRQCSHADFYSSICQIKPGLIGIKKGKDSHLSLLLPDMDSNHDILNQNQLYYPYTIGQSLHSYRMGCKNRGGGELFQIF